VATSAEAGRHQDVAVLVSHQAGAAAAVEVTMAEEAAGDDENE
jgi:hypothetical protein